MRLEAVSTCSFAGRLNLVEGPFEPLYPGPWMVLYMVVGEPMVSRMSISPQLGQ